MDCMFPCYSLIWKLFDCTWFVLPLPLQWGDLIWKFAKLLWWQNFFLHLWQDKPLWVELKINGGVIFMTILIDFHYFICLETTNTQKSGIFLLRISSRKLLFKIYIFSFRQEFLETLCKCIYLGFNYKF